MLNPVKPGCPPFKARHQAGFTLVEIAVVLIIMTILAALGLSAVGALQQNAGTSSTVKKQETLKSALIAYLRNNRRLPCPDIDFDGVEDRAAGALPPPDVTKPCSADHGQIPNVTLGLPREAALDGFDNLFSYFVSKVVVTTVVTGTTLAPNTDWTLTANPSTGVRGFTPGNFGAIQVAGENGQALTNTANPETLAVVVIVSHGANGQGAKTPKGTTNAGPAVASTDEVANATGSAATTLHQRQATDNASATGGPFDDITMVLRPADLLGPLFAEGSIKPAIAITLERVNALRDYLVSQTATPTACPIPFSLPAGFPPTSLVDGWGNPISYRQLTTTANGAPPSAQLFTLSATNPIDGAVIGPSEAPTGVILKNTYPIVSANCL